MLDGIGAGGNSIKMSTLNSLHFSGEKSGVADREDVSGSFADILNGAISKINDLQVDSEKLAQKMVYQPESVDVHSVMIAGQKAELALTFAKSVRDEAIRAYKDLVNLR